MENGTIKYVKGDVTEPQKLYDNEISIIPHCCNNHGVMGAGVALALSNKWSGVYYYYAKMCAAYEKKKDLLGGNSYVNPSTDKNEVMIINMIGQDGTVSITNPKPVKYWALLKCMQDVVEQITIGNINLASKKPVFHCPKFGSDLAGGDWDFIEQLVKKIWVEDAGFDVVIYEFESNPEKWGEIK